MPSAGHPRSKYQVDESIRAIYGMAGFAQCIDDLATIQRDFQPLKSEALASALRSHNYSEISERKVHIGKMCKILNLKR